jgi:hypothetical protein
MYTECLHNNGGPLHQQCHYNYQCQLVRTCILLLVNQVYLQYYFLRYLQLEDGNALLN